MHQEAWGYRHVVPQDCRSGGEGVVPGRAPLTAVHVGDAGNGQEEHAPGRQDPADRTERGGEVVHEVQRLGEVDAVEGVVGQERTVGEVAGVRGAVDVVDVENVGALDPVTTESAGVRVVPDLEDAPTHVGLVRTR